MKKILVIHGPNLNLLGSREVEIYGNDSLEDVNVELRRKVEETGDFEVLIYSTNHEGKIIDFLQIEGRRGDGLIINPGGYTHTSVAIRDAIQARELITVEVHISNIYKRESFRKKSYYHDISEGVITGLGVKGYYYALDYLIDRLRDGN